VYWPRLGALEITWWSYRANVEKQGEGDGKVEVDAQNVCSKGSAETHCSLKINETIEEGAARGHWWLTQGGVHQPV